MIPVVFDCGILVSAIGWVGNPRRCRDRKDDPYLACAVGARAQFIVSNDRDLLVLQKPFGVAIVTPIQLLLHVRGEAEV